MPNKPLLFKGRSRLPQNYIIILEGFIDSPEGKTLIFHIGGAILTMGKKLEYRLDSLEKAVKNLKETPPKLVTYQVDSLLAPVVRIAVKEAMTQTVEAIIRYNETLAGVLAENSSLKKQLCNTVYKMLKEKRWKI